VRRRSGTATRLPPNPQATHDLQPFCSVLANLLELSDCQEQLRLLKGIPLVVANLTAPTGFTPLSFMIRNIAVNHVTTCQPTAISHVSRCATPLF
jgi:hypothetical protein